MARAFTQTHPDKVAGVVFVDAFSPTVPALLGDGWAVYRDQGLNAPLQDMPIPSLRSPDAERVDLDASIDGVLGGPPFPDIPIAVLTKTEPFAGLSDLPGLPAAVINRVYQDAQLDYVGLVAGTPQMLATGSDHYIQFSQPDLVVAATELVSARIDR